jgi:hypothetical protein
MVIGAFFSEVGTNLPRRFSLLDPHFDRIRAELRENAGWSDRDYARARRDLQSYTSVITIEQVDFDSLRTFLTGRWEFLLRLLENPLLLEHETFTDLLWAVFHLTEELSHRTDPSRLSRADREHLAGDIRRAYALLLAEWLEYTRHLQHNYPYLFSLAVRMNPCEAAASVEVQSPPEVSSPAEKVTG